MPFVIQSIIFFKSGWTKPGAIEWLKKHNKKTGIDEKEHTWRARQIDPSKFNNNTFRIKEINDHMDFVIGVLKSK